jgi:hypothetical protein
MSSGYSGDSQTSGIWAAPASVQSGQILQLRVRSGQCLVVHAGCLRLQEAPSWLADTMFAPACVLRRGACHRLQASGWITLQVQATASFDLLSTPPSFAARWVMGVRRLLGLVRGRRSGTFKPSHS